MLIVETLDAAPHATLRLINKCTLARAKIADTDLHKFADLWNARHHIVKDARMRIVEAFERVAQVGVCIDLQDAKPGMTLCKFANEPERTRMIAA